MISIITPTFYRLEYLMLCIRSLHEIEGDFEHIVVCNPSTDGTAEWLRHVSESPYYHRLKPIFMSSRLGNADSMNMGIMQAKGKYIMQLDNDIELQGDKKKILDVFTYLLKDSSVGAVGATLTGIGSKIPAEAMGLKEVEINDTSYRFYLEGVPFITACFMMKRDFLNEVGSYRKEPGKWVSQMCSDLSARIRQSGRRIIRVREIEAWHIDGTDGQAAKYRDYFMETNPPKE